MFRARAAVASAFLVSSSLTIAAPVDDAKKLLLQGKAAQGMEILENHLAANAGDIEFNYLLGIASLDAGKPGEALFAFERVLALDPNHPQARAELAKALIALVEYEAARIELLQVKAKNPPPEVAANVDKMLALIDRLVAESQQKRTTIWSGYVEGELGYDTNINTAPNATSIFIPALGLPASLSGFSTAQKAGLFGVSLGASVSTQVSDGIDFFASISGRFRGHEAVNFALGSASETFGVRFARDRDQFSLGYTRFDQYIGQFHNDAQNGLFVDWKREMGNQDIVGAFGQVLEIRHPIVPFLDTNMLIAGGTWTHAFLRDGDPQIHMTAYYGEDRALRNNPTISRNLVGISARGEYKLYENLKLIGNASVQHSDYAGQNIFFRTQRRDDRYDISIGAAYKPDQKWTITPQYLYTRNQSTISFNLFDRSQLLLTARRDFF